MIHYYHDQYKSFLAMAAPTVDLTRLPGHSFSNKANHAGGGLDTVHHRMTATLQMIGGLLPRVAIPTTDVAEVT